MFMAAMPRPGPLRIGLDVRLTYYTRGGIARYIRRLGRDLPGLAPDETHVHFYRRGHTETFSTRARRVDCWTPAHHRLETWALSAEVLPHHLDLLHSPDFIPPRWGSRRSVITVHDLAFWRYPEFLTPESRAYYNGQIRYAVRRAHAISADSHATKADLVDLLGVPPEKITVIHLGLDPEYRPMEASQTAPLLERLGLPRGYILFVGTFEPRKNVDGLLLAYHQLHCRRPDAPPLVLAGHRGWMFEPAADRIQALGLARHVHVLEDFPGADLPALYNGASLLVLPSHYEGFGFPVLEAMGCGVPCVIANRASLPEIAGQAALAIDPDSAEELAEAMERLLADEALRADLAHKGLDRAAQFTWDATARATHALYHQVLLD